MKRALVITFLIVLTYGAWGQSPGSYYGLSYGGRSARVNIADDTTLNFTGSISVEAWIKADSFKSGGNTSCIVSKHGANGGYDLRCNVNGGVAFRFGTSSGWKFAVSKTKLEKGRWYHVAGTYNGDSICIYVNGSLERVKYETVALGTSYGVALKFGEYSKSGISPTPGGNFDGEIDEIRIWNTALTTKEINQWMYRKLNRQHTSRNKLVGNWRFDEAMGSTTYDRTINANHGQIGRAIWRRSGAPIGDSFILDTTSNLTYKAYNNTELSIAHQLPGAKRAVLYWVGEPSADTLIKDALAVLDSQYFGVFSPDTARFAYDFTLSYNALALQADECLLDVFEKQNIYDEEWQLNRHQFNPAKNQFRGLGCTAAQLNLVTYFKQRKVAIRDNDSTLCVGQNARFTAYGNDSFTYQWYKDGVKLASDTSRIFKTGIAGTYQVAIKRHSGCDYKSVPIKVTVNQLPTVRLPRLKSICDYDDTLVVKQGTPVGGQLSGSVITNDSFVVPSLYSAGVYNVIYGYTDSIGCYSADTQRLRIQQKPSASFVKTQTTCNDKDTVHLKMGRPFGGVYTGNGVLNNAFYVDSVKRRAGDYKVVYYFTDSVGCKDTANGKLTVFSATAVDFPDIGDTCANSGRIKLKSDPQTPYFKGQGVQSGFFYPSQVSVGTYKLTCSYVNFWGCTTYDTSIITVKRVDSVQFTLTDSLCMNADSIRIDKGMPVGGFYTGYAVSANNYFDPGRVTASGNVPIMYRYTNSSGCSDSAMAYVHVLDTLALSLSLVKPVCPNGSDFKLADVSPMGGVYSVNSVLDTLFRPSQLGEGEHEISYRITAGNKCESKILYKRKIFERTSISFSDTSMTICENADSVRLQNAQPVGGKYSGLKSQNGYLNPTLHAPGTYTIHYTIQDTNDCVSGDSFGLEVLGSPEVSLGLDSIYCENGMSVALNGQGMPAGGEFIWNEEEINQLSPSVLGVGKHVVSYTYAAANGCSDTAFSPLHVFAAPDKPILSATDSSIMSSSLIRNQWHNLQGLLNGDTSQIIHPKQEGNYYVVVKNKNCSTHSDTVYFKPLSVSKGQTLKISAFPNPVSNYLSIEGLPSGSLFTLSWMSLNGQTLYHRQLESTESIIEVDERLPNGIYLLCITSREGLFIERIEVKR